MNRKAAFLPLRIVTRDTYRTTSVTQTPFPLKGRDWLRANPGKRMRLVEVAFRYWRRQGFPRYRLSRQQIRTEFRNLFRFNWQRVFARGRLRGSSVGLRLANFFHPSMWSVRVSRYRSPIEVFRDDRLLRLAIQRALTIWPNRFAANASCLRRMLKTFPGTASVSNFKPTVAKAVIAKYSADGDLVVDCCAGYGGRLLGCLTLPRRYLGIEPCSRQVVGLRGTIRAIKKLGLSPCEAQIRHGCAEEIMKDLTSKCAQLIFSSPPYFNWEKYSRHSTQSLVRYRTYAYWLSHFLRPVIRQGARILKAKGFLVLNVSDGKRLPTRHDVIRIGHDCGLTLAGQHFLVLPKVPYLHPRDGIPEKREVLLVFAKA